MYSKITQTIAGKASCKDVLRPHAQISWSFIRTERKENDAHPFLEIKPMIVRGKIKSNSKKKKKKSFIGGLSKVLLVYYTMQHEENGVRYEYIVECVDS